jgi:hypothetical protein
LKTGSQILGGFFGPTRRDQRLGCGDGITLFWLKPRQEDTDRC